jgi:SAM-dependent methyltransferase
LAKKLNVGCGRNILPEWVNLDFAPLPGVDIVHDLERCGDAPLPLEDNSIDEFLLSHVIEHIRSTLPLMQELHRVAKPGAKAVIRLPHGASDDAWEDPTHVRSYFPGSFGYFSQPFYWRADYGYRGDWQLDKLYLIVSKQAFAGMKVEAIQKSAMENRNVIREMVAEMRAIKPIRAPLKELQTPPRIEYVLS